MEPDEQIRTLLEEIRNDQRVLIQEYRSVTKNALDLQKQAVQRQEALGRLYKGALVAATVVVVVIIVIIVYLLSMLANYF